MDTNKNSRAPIIAVFLLAAVLVLQIIFNAGQRAELQNLQNQLAALQGQYQMLSGNLYGMENNIAGAIEEKLQAQSSLFSEQTVSEGRLNPATLQTSYTVYVLPKAANEKTTALLYYNGASSEMKRSGPGFSAEVTIDYTDTSPALSVSLMQQEGEGAPTRQNEKLSVAIYPQDLFSSIQADFNGTFRYQEGKLYIENGNISAGYSFAANSGHLLATINEKEVWRHEVTQLLQKDEGYGKADIGISKAFDLAAGQKFALFIELTDKEGISYRQFQYGTQAPEEEGNRLLDYYAQPSVWITGTGGTTISR